MKKKLGTILLIDDDEATNFIHEMVIRQADIAEKVVSVEGGQLALDFLSNLNENNEAKPDLIFLDINMPGMNGWEFLEKYNNLDEEKRGSIVMVMLTTSLNPDDAQKSKSYKSIRDFLNKPLTKAILENVINKHFSEYL